MRSAAAFLLVVLVNTAHAVNPNDGFSLFSESLFGLSNNELLVKRSGCGSGYNACSGFGASSVCCPTGTNCALDDAGHIACCPTNAKCTGTIGGTATASATSSSSEGTTTTSSTTSTTTSATTTTGVAGGGSTVPNNYYPFVYIPTSYANAALCTSAYSSCQTASTSCFASLAGANGVTISGLGGGITVAGTSGTVLSSASSICSSLSSEGCYNLKETQCSMFGTASGSTTVTTTASSTSGGFVQVGNDGPRRTACPRMLYAAGAGAVFGAMGGLV
ncbi:hypothetical protein EDD37DRAFT_83873 [Exophiala viscosa]|uniref:uncharacterized protein n=1 Tax=Exophiala viscosa TaxID=2486360 RepID=UPI00219BA577|nr:hypothetical protein EDD37DRAFT_83873 [Exophiala viscosa]